jgi:nucleotide-binding universal stress UspA family protein
MAEKIVVGLDGSAGSALALSWVVAHAHGHETHVVAVDAIRPLGEFLLDLPGTGVDDWREKLRWQLEQEWCKPLADAGISYRALTVDESPVAALCQIADAEKADMIVVGSEGHGSLAGRVLGSVSYGIAHTAHHPVVIVPADWKRAD